MRNPLLQSRLSSVLFLSDGSEIPASTLMDTLLMKDFKLVINNLPYDIRRHEKGKQRPSAILTFALVGGFYREQSNLVEHRVLKTG